MNLMNLQSIGYFNKIILSMIINGRKTGYCIWRKLQTNGEEMVKVMSGRKIGLNTTMHLVKLRNGHTNGAVLTQTHPSMLGMLMSGTKGNNNVEPDYKLSSNPVFIIFSP
jgi:hypothetical protein